MTFPGGSVDLPTTLLSSGMSGAQRIHEPEQPSPMSRMTDAALERLAENLLKLLDQHHDAERKQGGVNPGLHEYIDLLWMQVTDELMRRMSHG